MGSASCWTPSANNQVGLFPINHPGGFPLSGFRATTHSSWGRCVVRAACKVFTMLDRLQPSLSNPESARITHLDATRQAVALEAADGAPKAEFEIVLGKGCCSATFSGRSIDVWTSTDVQMPKTWQQPDKIRRGARSVTNFSIGVLHEFLRKWQKTVGARCVRSVAAGKQLERTRSQPEDQPRRVIIAGAVLKISLACAPSILLRLATDAPTQG